MTRRDKINYYLDIAESVLKRGTCMRRNFGAIIVKNDEIISTGYVGAPRGRANCSDLAIVRVKSSTFRKARDMSSAVQFMLKQTQSFPHQETK